MRYIEAARKALGRFCKGEGVMHIPVQESDDDQIISRALDRLEKLEHENARLRAAINKVYPSIAGLAICFQQEGKTIAANAWDKVAKTLIKALERSTPDEV